MQAVKRWALAAAVAGALAWPAGVARASEPEELQYNAVAALYNAGQWEAAIQKIEEREKLELSDAMRARYLYAKGLAYEKGEKFEEARAAYAQLLKDHANAAEAPAARLAALYLDYAAGNLDAVLEAYPHVDQANLPESDKRNLALMRAEALYAKKDDAAALEAYQAAVAAGNDAAAVEPKLFELYTRLGMNAELLALSADGVPGVEADLLALVRAEALLASDQFAEADAEAQKVPDTSPHHPRASLARAQALIRQEKLAEAVAPLEAAIAGMKDPPAPPGAYLALAECLLAADRAADVEAALAAAERAGRSLPDEQKAKLTGQIGILRIRAANGGDAKQIIEAISQSRESVPADQLGKVLYMRLFALAEEGDHAGVLATMEEDYPVFQQGEEDGPATMIYYVALKESDRAEEANKLLEAYLARKPDSPEALRARLALAGAALEGDDAEEAAAHLDALLAAPQAPEVLGKEALDEARFNRAAVAHKAGDHAKTIELLAALLANTPADSIQRQALAMLGQSYAVQKDYANAAATWKQAVAAGGLQPAEESDLRDRLARVLFAAGDAAGAIEQFEAAAKLAGDKPLPRESREVWARALFTAERFEDAAALYGSLAAAHADTPAYAYEAAVALERAGKPDEAATLYAAAAKQKDKLPQDYAAAVDANLARLRLSSGEGDMGLATWLERLAAAETDEAFEAAAAALRKIAAAGKVDDASRDKLAEAMAAAPADSPRRYTLGAIVLHSLVVAGKDADARKLGAQLASEFAANESKLPEASSGRTLAPAMIYTLRGDAERAGGSHAEALVAYETVLAAYPYNEWPDAAACGAAECYAALGDRETAVAKFKEVLAAEAGPESVPWRELAQRRITELEKGS